MYQRRPLKASHAPVARSALAPKPRLKPLKRPLQARSKFTVQAIYEAFANLWGKGGSDAVTTRAIALEAGVSIGALYEYFPNKESVLSGYVRLCVDALLDAIAQQAIAPAGLSWRERVHCAVVLCCGVQAETLPVIDHAMLMHEYQIAEPKHHRRVYDELLATWLQVFAACTDLPQPPAPDMLKALFVSIWGGRRYLLLVEQADFPAERWAEEIERLCCAALDQGQSEQGA